MRLAERTEIQLFKAYYTKKNYFVGKGAGSWLKLHNSITQFASASELPTPSKYCL